MSNLNLPKHILVGEDLLLGSPVICCAICKIIMPIILDSASNEDLLYILVDGFLAKHEHSEQLNLNSNEEEKSFSA